MASPRRYIIVLATLCAGFGLSGCANGNFELDPAYWFPDGKKKLPGERRELFPDGVPGVTQGIPPELIRGHPAHQAAQQQALGPIEGAEQPQEPTQPQPPPQPAPQVEETPKPRPKRVARPRPAPPPPEPQAQPAARPAPQQAPTGAWPQAEQQQPAPASAWPSPPASGTFTR